MCDALEVIPGCSSEQRQALSVAERAVAIQSRKRRRSGAEPVSKGKRDRGAQPGQGRTGSDREGAVGSVEGTRRVRDSRDLSCLPRAWAYCHQRVAAHTTARTPAKSELQLYSNAQPIAPLLLFNRLLFLIIFIPKDHHPPPLACPLAVP